tara:strand:+ start:201 stop:1580 length:1380 start_codon:yes stop_codon:yes gene_type:complete
MSFDLTNQNISDTFQNLLQKTGSNNQLYDLKGNKITNLMIEGDLIASRYITSESIMNTSSGSTLFGNSSDDSHYFSGSITASGNIRFLGETIKDAGNLTVFEFSNNGYINNSQTIKASIPSLTLQTATDGDRYVRFYREGNNYWSFGVDGTNSPAGNTDSFVISNTSTPHWPTAPFSIGRVDGVVGVSGSLSASIYKNYPVVYLQHSSSDGYEALRINQRGSGEFIYGISKYNKRSFRLKQTTAGAAELSFYGSASNAGDNTGGNPGQGENGTEVHFIGDPYTATETWFCNTAGREPARFGIGTKTPPKALTVSGSISASGNIEATPYLQYNTSSVSSTGNAQGDIVKFGNFTTLPGAVYALTGSTWSLAHSGSDNNASSSLAMAVGTNSTTHGMLLRGMINMGYNPGGSNGSAVYLSTPGSGSYAPTSISNHIVRIIGWNFGGNTIYFNPDNTWIKVA